MIRHFTASAIVLQDEHVLLIEHHKLGLWLYPGGHIEANEDPVQALRREVHEEVGLDIDILADIPFRHPAVVTVEAPFAILVEDVTDRHTGPHQHIDLIYVCTPKNGATPGQEAEYKGYQWVPLDRVSELDTPPELPELIDAATAHAARTRVSTAR